MNLLNGIGESGWLAEPRVALGMAVFLSLLVAWESVFARWAPYFLIYAVLAIAVPLAAGTCAFGPPWKAIADHFPAIAAAGAGMACWEIGLFHWVYEVWWLGRRGRGNDPSLSVPGAVKAMLSLAATRTGIPPDRAETVFAAYTLAWAPIGEELFYWGYLFTATRPDWGFAWAASATAMLFAFRHAVHFLYFRKGTPPVPAAILAVSALGSGLINCWLYERIGSLWPLILLHVIMNLLWVASIRIGSGRA